jgi:hypothetical protein
VLTRTGAVEVAAPRVARAFLDRDFSGVDYVYP